MEKFKISVYAISKNESKFVDRWYESVKEADEIYVLDTGSEDDTVTRLMSKGISVTEKKYDFFRFDVARNDSLNLVSEDTDICVCIDLDEVMPKGWRKILENAWTDNTTRLRYNYNWRLDKFNKPLINFCIEKIHSRYGYKWIHPVYEVLSYEKNEVITTCNDLTVNHYPDCNKSRSSYLPLLELSVKEDPLDDRNMHYLGREYMYYGKWNKCIDTLINHLKLKRATWRDERCASMRYIARSYSNLERYDEAKMWLDKAILEAPHLRDPFMERALLEYKLENWDGVINYCIKALEIKEKPKSYINEIFSLDETVYDLLSLAYFYTAKIDKAIAYVNKAILINPDNERLKKNKQIFMSTLHNKQ